MKVILVGGFLGSGKTSVVLQMARYLTGVADTAVSSAVSGKAPETRVVIIENEIGEVGIDDRVLEASGLQVQGLFSGCVCCTLSGELVTTLRQIKETINPQYLIMEATGVAYPQTIREVLDEAFTNMDCTICCITDAGRWKRLSTALENVIRPQLSGADLILINKIDLVDAAALAAVETSIRAINGQAACFPVSALKPVDTAIWDRLR
jgi:G3E family GTPase